MVSDDNLYLLDDDDRESLDSIIEEYKMTAFLKKKKNKTSLGSEPTVFCIQSSREYERIDGTVTSGPSLCTNGKRKSSSRRRTVIVTKIEHSLRYLLKCALLLLCSHLLFIFADMLCYEQVISLQLAFPNLRITPLSY